MGQVHSGLSSNHHPFSEHCKQLETLFDADNNLFVYALNVILVAKGVKKAYMGTDIQQHLKWNESICKLAPYVQALARTSVTFMCIPGKSGKLLLLHRNRKILCEARELLELPSGNELDRRLALLLGLPCYSMWTTQCLQMSVRVYWQGVSLVLITFSCTPQNAAADEIHLRRLERKLRRFLVTLGIKTSAHISATECRKWFEVELKRLVMSVEKKALQQQIKTLDYHSPAGMLLVQKTWHALGRLRLQVK
jgi:hypothetical protein